jgi:sn-glycerol 3-phosphate transport system substrate-binding protein
MNVSDEVVIKATFCDYLYAGFMDPLFARAEEFAARHPGYRVEVTGHDFREIPKVMAEAAVRGTLPDITGYYYTATQFARDTRDADGEPAFTSVQREIGGRTHILGEKVVLDELVPAARGCFSYDGELVSLPLTASTAIMLANADVLDAAGVTTMPDTWGELTAACAAVKESTGGAVTGVTWANHGWFFLEAVGQQGGMLVDRDNGRSGRSERVNLTSPEVLAYARWWQALNDAGHFLYTGEIADWSGAFDAFAEGRVAFSITSSVELRRVTEAVGDSFRLVATALPHNENAPHAGSQVGGDSLWLTAGLDPVKRDGALAFMQYLLRPEHAATWHRSNDRIPLTRSAIDLLDAEGWFAANPNARVASEQLDLSDGSPGALGMLTGAFAAIQNGAPRAIHDLLVAGADPLARFTEAEAVAQQQLADYNAECAGGTRTPGDLTVAW